MAGLWAAWGAFLLVFWAQPELQDVPTKPMGTKKLRDNAVCLPAGDYRICAVIPPTYRCPPADRYPGMKYRLLLILIVVVDTETTLRRPVRPSFRENHRLFYYYQLPASTEWLPIVRCIVQVV